MKISDFDTTEVNGYLKITDFENFFTVHEDEDGYFFYNLNSNLYIDIDKSQLKEFTCDHTFHWPLISYKIYGTTRLAWLLWKLNDVSAADIFKPKHPGDKVLFLERNYVESIVADLNDFDDM